MARDYFPCRYSYRPILETFSDTELGRLFKALLKYGDTGERSDLPGKEQVAFEFMAADLDRANEAYQAKCKTLSENGKKGGRPKANGFFENQTEATETKQKPIKESKEKQSKVKQENSNKRFTPPTPAEVQEYCNERNNGINGQHFVDYYATRGWKVGKDTMKDWKAAVRTWERNGFSKPVSQVDNQFQPGTAERAAIEAMKRRRRENA